MSVKILRHEMPCQPAEVRRDNFSEVALGYSEETAIDEAKRCLNCKNPLCVQGCPVEVPIPEFIGFIKNKDFAGAIAKIKEKNNLPGVCGRVCPQESQCEAKCILTKKGKSVAIGRLERFAADMQTPQEVSVMPSNGKKVAVVGAGPAGLTCAGDLRRMGYDVTVFEALHVPGGVLMYGIPEFRLPKAIVQEEIEYIKSMGVNIKVNQVVGKITTVDELLEKGFSAVFIGTGAGLPYFMNISGENLLGVYSANEFLTRTNLMKGYLFPVHDTPVKVGEKVAVIGGGNVAMDAARTSLRLGAKEVYIVYRRTMDELPARHEEVEHAIEEGVQFKLLRSPVEITGDEAGWVKEMRCQKFCLGEADASGRCAPVCIEGEEEIIKVDTVIMAIGQGPNPLLTRTTPGLNLTKRGNIDADCDSGVTSKPGVFAGGDIVTGAATVILAMGAGKKAAHAIDEYLKDRV